ncbi:MAG TPA: lysylphosphatidylglycerol synthase domain-containing protein [Stellaceae bacterium]|nr:lysylphosphatidylglycerol synthase domain-containing protein [Stellaceae bacterium]
MMRLWMIVAAVLGLAMVVVLIVHSGADEVARAMLLVGWGLIPVSLYHVVPMVLSALSWRELLPRPSALGFGAVTWIRWVRESVTSLLPVAGVGGDLVGARLAYVHGVPGAQAAASMVVDVTVGVATQLLFVAIGLALLLSRSTAPAVLAVAWFVLIGIGVFMAAIAIFLRLQHRGMFAVSARLAGMLLRHDRHSGAAAIDEAVVAIYRDRPALLRANLVRLAGWAAGTGEIWLVMRFLGRPMDMIDAFILESLGAGVRAAAFMVPGALGVLEGSYVAFCALFGLPAETALTIALSKRVRELALGLPGLIVWHWVEGRRLLRRG